MQIQIYNLWKFLIFATHFRIPVFNQNLGINTKIIKKYNMNVFFPGWGGGS